MNDCIQLLHSSVDERNLRQRTAIQPSIRQYHTFAKMVDDARIDRLPWLHQLAPDHVCLDDMRAMSRKQSCRSGLPASETACKADAQHGGYFFSWKILSEIPRRSFAA